MKKILLSILILCFLTPLFAAEKEKPLTFSERISKLKKLDGFFPLYWDEKEGKLYLEINQWNKEFIYINSLPAGVGSNDIGLDRGQIGENRIVYFWRSGPKALLIQPNYAYRAVSSDAAEQRAVEESFAKSVLWAFTIVAEENDHALVDASEFYLRDAHHVTQALKDTQQGTFTLDNSRSAFYLPNTKNFPLNTEVETLLTFTGNDPGEFVKQVVPSPNNISVRERHSFVSLPGPGYTPRVFDPRSGYFGITYMDYATPVQEPIRKRFICRHRLNKKDPGAAVSDAVEPIVYYLDPGTPEPIRSALLEGASWWNQAFEAAGYRNAFRVEMLPPDADPLDVRYNVIQWIHRATRGYSYGNVVADPRTGEIIKGHVSLGSLRVRQDYLIAEGLLAPYESGKPADPKLMNMALARLRQLAAHEVGHTLGLSHNYIASTVNRASVMDYPHPLVLFKDDGSLDLEQAYATGIGEWDKITIAYGYQDFAQKSDEGAQLNQILQNGIKRNLIFLSDSDARPDNSAHPRTHLWDNGPDAVAELDRVMKIRQKALSQFSEKNIREGTPLSTLENVLVPMYLFHRYQLIAAAKVLGGLEYTYAVRGDNQTAADIVPAEDQKRALKSLLATLDPQALTLPENILHLIAPTAEGYTRDREMFQLRTAPAFDPLSAAETAATMTVNLILNPERDARLVEFHARDLKNPGFVEVADALVDSTWKAKHDDSLSGEVRRAIDNIVLQRFMWLASNDQARAQVRAVATSEIESLRKWIGAELNRVSDPAQRAHLQFSLSQIQVFQQDPSKVKFTAPVQVPAGAPIGAYCSFEP
jgi:hypothetical protein